MTEHCNEHCGYTVETGYLLTIYAGKPLSRRETRDRRHCCAVSYGSRHSEYHSKTMKHRNLYHHAVSSRKIHAVTDSLAIVHNIVVSEHNSLRKACRARSVLHIAHVIDVDFFACSFNLAIWDVLGKLHCFLPCIAAVVFRVNSDNILQEWQFFGIEFSRLTSIKFRAEFLYYRNIVDILYSVYHYKSARVGLPEQILSLMNAVFRIHCYKYRADFCSCPESYVPLRNISCPY